MTAINVHRPATYADLILLALRRYPTRTAFIQGDSIFTYAETADTIARLISVLHRYGLRAGDGAAILAKNRSEAWFVQAALTIMGCRFTPLQASGSEDDHAYICADAEVRVLIFEASNFAEGAVGTAEQVPGLNLLGIGASDAAPDLLAMAAQAERSPLASVVEIDDICWIPYTGGTTGRPKGVVLPHRSMTHNAFLTLTEFEWPADIRYIACTPITHGAGPMIVPTLLRGGTVILQSGFDPEAFANEVERTRATATFIVPTMISMLLDGRGVREHDLSSLETIIYGASPMSPARMEQALEVFGPVFNQLYAQTEAPNTATVLKKSEHDVKRPQLLGSCGRPMLGLDVEVHDATEDECAVGAVGEIVIRGPLVMDGYWKQPEQTAETLRNGWLHTGDMARRDEEGYLYIVDRSKDMIISGGFNVFPREVEDVLTTHPAVSAAAVIGVPDPKWGEAVKAVVVLKPGAAVGADELIALVRARKGPIHAPKSVDFTDSIPLTAVSKPDKKALRARYWDSQSRGVS